MEVLDHQHRIDRKADGDEGERVGDEGDDLPGQAEAQDGGGTHGGLATDIADHQSGKHHGDHPGSLESFRQHVGSIGEQDREEHLDQMLVDPFDQPVDQRAER